MRIFAVALFYVVGVLLLGALLSYPLYLLLERVADIPFHRLVSRAGLLVALLGFPFLIVYLGVASRQSLGFGLSARAMTGRVLSGWLLGGLTLLPVSAALLALDVRVIAPEVLLPSSDILRVIGKVLISALVIGLIEETLFRGVLYGAIVRRHSVAEAIVLSSLLYAALHFVRPWPVSSEALSWTSGVVSLVQGLWPLTDIGRMGDSFLALFAAGLLLALVRRYSGHLAYCIGLHAGWVTVIKLTRDFTDRNPESTRTFLVGSYDYVTGTLAAVWLAVLCLFLVLAVKYWGRVDGRR